MRLRGRMAPCALSQQRDPSLVPEQALMATALQQQLPCSVAIQWGRTVCGVPHCLGSISTITYREGCELDAAV